MLLLPLCLFLGPWRRLGHCCAYIWSWTVLLSLFYTHWYQVCKLVHCLFSNGIRIKFTCRLDLVINLLIVKSRNVEINFTNYTMHIILIYLNIFQVIRLSSSLSSIILFELEVELIAVQKNFFSNFVLFFFFLILFSRGYHVSTHDSQFPTIRFSKMAISIKISQSQSC